MAGLAYNPHVATAFSICRSRFAGPHLDSPSIYTNPPTLDGLRGSFDYGVDYNQQSTPPFPFGSSKSLGQPISSPIQNIHPAQRLDIRDPP
jgi:hypothetical protein